MRTLITDADRIVAREGLLHTALDSETAGLVEFRGRDGLIMAVMTRISKYPGWLFACRTEPEFIIALLSSGYNPEDVEACDPGTPGRVRIFDMAGDLVLDTGDVSVIELHQCEGGLAALFTKYFNDDMWIHASKYDSDWGASLNRAGYT